MSSLGDALASLSVHGSTAAVTDCKIRDSISIFGRKGELEPHSCWLIFINGISLTVKIPNCSCRGEVLRMRPWKKKRHEGRQAGRAVLLAPPPGPHFMWSLSKTTGLKMHHSSSKGIQHLWCHLNTTGSGDIQHLPRLDNQSTVSYIKNRILRETVIKFPPKGAHVSPAQFFNCHQLHKS